MINKVKSRARVCLVWVRPDLLNPVFDVHNFYFNSHFLSLNLQPSTSSLEKHICKRHFFDIFQPRKLHSTFVSRVITGNTLQGTVPKLRMDLSWSTNSWLVNNNDLWWESWFKLIFWFLFWEKYVLSWENDKIKL
jgi:hypothetical protein